jgi:hypothetical protein
MGGLAYAQWLIGSRRRSAGGAEAVDQPVLIMPGGAGECGRAHRFPWLYRRRAVVGLVRCSAYVRRRLATSSPW